MYSRGIRSDQTSPDASERYLADRPDDYEPPPGLANVDAVVWKVLLI